MIKNSLHISSFLDFVREAESQYAFCAEEMKTQDKLTQDILHSIELDGLKSGERSKLATKLKTNRKDRRYYKDRVEEYAPVAEYIRKNKQIINGLTQLLGEVRKQEKYHENRTYFPKVLKVKKGS